MKKIILLLVGLMLLSSCGVARHLNLDAPKFVPVKPGKVSFFHWNEGVYGHAVLFRDSLSEDDMFAVDPRTGSLIWANPVIDSFVIQPAKGRECPRINYLHLLPEAEYTMYVFWTRFNGRELDGENVVHFRTRLNSRSECRTSNLGKATCASVIVDFPQVNASAPGQFSYHKTLYVGDWVKALFDLP